MHEIDTYRRSFSPHPPLCSASHALGVLRSHKKSKCKALTRLPSLTLGAGITLTCSLILPPLSFLTKQRCTKTG